MIFQLQISFILNLRLAQALPLLQSGFVFIENDRVCAVLVIDSKIIEKIYG